MIKVLTTPEDRFPDLPNFSYNPMYVDDLNGTVPDPMNISEAGHFVKEWGEEIARRAQAAVDG
jgi:hypothetical protein